MTHLSFYDLNVAQSECAHRLVSGNTMSSAHVMNNSLLCLLDKYPPFVTAFVLSVEDQETGK